MTDPELKAAVEAAKRLNPCENENCGTATCIVARAVLALASERERLREDLETARFGEMCVCGYRKSMHDEFGCMVLDEKTRNRVCAKFSPRERSEA